MQIAEISMDIVHVFDSMLSLGLIFCKYFENTEGKIFMHNCKIDSKNLSAGIIQSSFNFPIV